MHDDAEGSAAEPAPPPDAPPAAVAPSVTPPDPPVASQWDHRQVATGQVPPGNPPTGGDGHTWSSRPPTGPYGEHTPPPVSGSNGPPPYGPSTFAPPYPMAPMPFGAAPDTSGAVAAHIVALFVGVIGSAIYYAASPNSTPFVKHHITEALNFTITMAIASIITIVLCFVLVGFLLLPVLVVVNIVFPILAAVAANRGEWYRYPLTLRLVQGPLDQWSTPA